eukprot:TRINITY_DN52526_c0_g2_i1.p1 TRINITY_DN52526_c0_g2~~TRINITY_DN52526_c0_g2_i1.p1  ORF type:complete len:592 (+),score=153.08 TRINITY_DN52526_c0_g2_i1:3190-4965(+)
MSFLESLFESSDSRKTSRKIEREFDFDKERKYDELKTTERELHERLRKALDDVDFEKKSIERKLKTRTATRDDERRLRALRDERDRLAEKLDVTKTMKATHTKVMLEKTEAEKEKLRKLRDVFSMIRKAEKVDLCFMVDCTGSMSSHISAVRDQIKAIVQKLKSSSANAKIFLSFLGYRDLCDGANQYSILDFTEDVDAFEAYVAGVVATGGGDGPEDIGGAYRKANALSWSQGTRVIIHIADAPAHGSQYHDWADDHPSGVGISLADELEKLRTIQVLYFFAHVVRAHTQKFITQLKTETVSPCVEEIELTTPEELTKLVTRTVRSSIRRTYTSVAEEKKDGEEADYPAFTSEPVLTKPSWSSVKTYKAVIERIRPYRSVDELKNSDLAVDRLKEKCNVQIAPTIMGKGAIRAAMYGRCDGKDVIFKKFLKAERDAVKEEMRFLQALEESEIARFLAAEFVKSGECPGRYQVTFLPSALVRVQLGPDKEDLYFMEPALPEARRFIKYVNNAAQWDEDELDEMNTLPLFAQWTHKFTSGYMMVADLQGVQEGYSYQLTDPVILCEDISRFGVTNLGPKMIDRYMSSLDPFV